MRKGFFSQFQMCEVQLFLETVTDAEIKNQATEFLHRKDLCQIIRREICFGLIPKTLKGKYHLKDF